MANIFGKDCSVSIFGEQSKANNSDPSSKGFSLRKDHILAGDANSKAIQVRLDPEKFEITDISCGRKQLTLKELIHAELLGLDADDHLQYVHNDIEREVTADHLFSGDPEFSADPLFSGTPLFTGDPVFSRNPLFSGDPLFTGDPEFQGNTLFSGPAIIDSQLKDKNNYAGSNGQVLISTANGVVWKTTATENVYWVSKSGNDNNDGLSETTAKLTLKSALDLVKSGYLGKLQDAADLIFSNKKLIQEESLGYLMTETNLDSFSFPQEANLDVKSQAARKVIFTNLTSIVSSSTSQISSNSQKYEKEVTNLAKRIGNDILWGGYRETREGVSKYFDVLGNIIEEIFTPSELTVMIQSLGLLKTSINNTLESSQPNYFGPIKNQVSSLIDHIVASLTNESMVEFPSKSKDNKFLVKSYFDRFTISNSVWSQVSPDYPSLSSSATIKLLKNEMRSIIIAVSEDIVSGGNSNSCDTSIYYVNNNIFNTAQLRSAILSCITEIGNELQLLLDDVEDQAGEYDYARSRCTELLSYISTSISSQSVSALPEKDDGIRNKSVNTCKRDIGFFIDAIASDLKNGGNIHSVEFGKAYFDSQNVIYIDGEVPQTISTLNKARQLMILAIRAWVTNSSGVLFKPVYSFENTFVKKGIIMETYPPCADVESTINNYYSIIEEILTNGPRSEYESAKDIIFSKVSEIIDYAWQQTVLEFPLLNETEMTCKRDLGFIIEAIAEDIYKSSNVNMREATQAYFGQNGQLIIDGVVGEESASIAAFESVRDYINTELLNSEQYDQVRVDVSSLVEILTTALSNNSLSSLPPSNTGTWSAQAPTFKATILLKSGVYEEDNPLQLPSNTAIVGDDLRSTTILAKNRIFDLFYVNNGSKIANVTFSNHLYPAFAVSFPRLNNQGTAGIISRSPYIQNCTSKTTTGGGMEVNGRYAEGFKSMVLDSYTQYNQGGIGVEISNSGYSQLVSLFTINCDKGVHARSGGQCDLNNSNASFGNFAMVADGVSEVEFEGQVAEFTKAGSNQIKIRGLGSTKPYNGQVLYFGVTYYELKNIKVINPGEGYLKPPIISIQPPSSPSGTPARGRTTIFNGKVDTALVLKPGRGYTTRTPSFTVQAPPPGGVQAEIELQMSPIYITVDSSTDVNDGVSTVTLVSPLTSDIERGTSVPFFKQSRILASSITLEYVGSGPDDKKSLPVNNGSTIQDNEVDMREGGLVIFTSTDQSGNFRIGDGVIIDQATGTIGGVSFSRGLFSQITPLILALQ